MMEPCILQSTCQYAIDQASAVSHEWVWFVFFVAAVSSANYFFIACCEEKPVVMKIRKACVEALILVSFAYLVYVVFWVL